ncbi:MULTISPECIES: Scr1 family TA system antitoxin-like transcriptional regulator [unclassified Micromonospora]|uniref:Scr1 family TA system antitoxin-like transcriptional regulator n=1 Tax=unclassified Micromonospora TaxID=2617518 RepID=UPI00363FEAB4
MPQATTAPSTRSPCSSQIANRRGANSFTSSTSIRPEDGPHAATPLGKFVLLDFANVRPIAYTEVLDGAMYVQDPDGVRTYSMVADNLRQVALSPAESRALIRELAGAA